MSVAVVVDVEVRHACDAGIVLGVGLLRLGEGNADEDEKQWWKSAKGAETEWPPWMCAAASGECYTKSL